MDMPDFSALSRSVTDGGHKFVYVRPGIVAAYYVTTPLREVGPVIADVIHQYMRFVGADALTHFVSENGTFKPLTEKRLLGDAKLLRRLPPDADISWEYSSDGNGGVGEYRVRLFAADPDGDFPKLTSLLRLEFPADAIIRYGVEELVKFIAAVAGALKPQSGHAGWGFKRAEPFAVEARKAVNGLLPRYLGFDACFDLVALTMRGHSPPAHWLNVIDADLFARCGGAEMLKRLEPGAHFQALSGVVLIRASRLPPVADVNRGARDVGCIPGVARFLKPTRVVLEGLGDDRFDVRAWLARFDERASLSWEQ